MRPLEPTAAHRGGPRRAGRRTLEHRGRGGDIRAEVTIRPAGPADLAAIAAIQAASPEASQWRPEDYLNYRCLLADNDAFIVTRQLAPGEHEILNLAVASGARRRGLARALLAHVVAAPGTWFLEVRASNTAAIRLYESTGFLPLGTRPGYYQESSETAIVMRYQK